MASNLNKRVLVTGASRGIGASLSKKFIDNNYFVIGVSKNNVCEFSNKQYFADLNDEISLDKLCQNLSKDKIDICVNVAGINLISNFLDISDDDFKSTLQINLFAPYKICKSVLPNMINNQFGRIVNISSVWGKISKQGRATYSASKFGLDGLTLALSHEYSSKNILCNSVSPGFVDTDMTRKNLGDSGIKDILKNVPISRLASPEEISELIFWLCNSNSYLTGQNIAIDGGFVRA